MPWPSCAPVNADGSVSLETSSPVLCCWKAHYDKATGAQVPGDCCQVDSLLSAADIPLANGGDAMDDYMKGWVTCIINEGSIYAFTIADPTLNTLPDGQFGPAPGDDSPKANAAAYPPVGTQYTACLARIGTHHGLTHYKPYGKHYSYHPLGLAKAYLGNYGHKYDHELYVKHCGGWQDSDCWMEVLLRNKTGGGLHAYNYCSGLGAGDSGYCPNASYVNVQIGVPWCKLSAGFHQGAARDSCWYVY